MTRRMTRPILFLPLVLGLFLGLTTGTAQAACIAEYKAKRDNPLELYYDMMTINGPCSLANATTQLRSALASRGLTLLKVLSVKEK